MTLSLKKRLQLCWNNPFLPKKTEIDQLYTKLLGCWVRKELEGNRSDRKHEGRSLNLFPEPVAAIVAAHTLSYGEIKPNQFVYQLSWVTSKRWVRRRRESKIWKKEEPKGPTGQQEREWRNWTKKEEQTTEPYTKTAQKHEVRPTSFLWLVITPNFGQKRKW
jgi:hypothetical protein